MFTHKLSGTQQFDSVGTLDIETSGFNGATEHLIAIGVGYYETGDDNANVAVHTQYDHDGDERELVRAAYEWLNNHDPDGLATFHGEGFDFEFLDDKQAALGFDDCPSLVCRSNHVDLIIPRKRKAEAQNVSWPSLEESLDAYQIPESETTWEGGKLTNTRFGEELAPKYVHALENGDMDALYKLEAVVREYTETDIEANLALYEHDAGREYLPSYAR